MAKKIMVKGPIIDDSHQRFYDWFGISATSPGKISDGLTEANGDDIEIEINSGGGSVFAASDIYTALRSYKGNVEVKITGLAASAASVIAMGGNKILMSPSSSIMIHNSSTNLGSGDKNDATRAMNMLSTIDKSIANIYIERTGITQNDILDMMSNETWLDIQSAKEMGFVDGSIFDEVTNAKNSFTNEDGTIPDAVINKLRDEFMVDGNLVLPKKNVTNEVKITQFRQKLLKKYRG